MVDTGAVRDRVNVSRETHARLEEFVALLTKWNRRINLVSPASLTQVWHRHIADSVQIWDHARRGSTWVDLGSGGGFPGIVLAILALEAESPAFTLVESDQRKATFLRQAIRDLDLRAEVKTNRIEDLPPLGADTISARALAPLPLLLVYLHEHLAPSGQALLHKGERYEAELSQAQERWTFDHRIWQSRTEPRGVILEVTNIAPA